MVVTRHNADTKEKLKRGDLIEFIRGSTFHWAVYIGDGKIIHLRGDGDRFQSTSEQVFNTGGRRLDKAKVCLDELDDFILDSKIYINNSKDEVWEASSPDAIVNRAKSLVGEVGYNIGAQNCEDFAKFCRYGNFKIEQILNWVARVLRGTLNFFGAVGALFRWK